MKRLNDDMQVHDRLLKLARELAQTAPEALNCTETLDRLAAYLEGLPKGEAPPPELEAVRLHLAKCPPCQAEFDALVKAVQG